MAEMFLCPPDRSLRFGDATVDELNDYLLNLEKTNSEHLDSVNQCSGCFKRKSIVEFVFLITEELELDELVGYHALELLQRFMVTHVTDQLTLGGGGGGQSGSPTDAIFDQIKAKFPFIVFSCVQLASKLSIHQQIVDNSTAVRFLQSSGYSVSKQTVLEFELMVLKGLDFRLHVPNPLTYVEILLEALRHNDPSIPVERLHHLCLPVLRFITLERTDIYRNLLLITLQCDSPSSEQRECFLKVTEDFMLLGVGVIAVAAVALKNKGWKQVVEELSGITAITKRSIQDFTRATVKNILSP